MASTIKSGSNNDLYIQTDGVDRIVVDSNGNTSIIGSVLSVENATGWGEAHLNGATGGDLILQDDGVNIGEVYAGVGHGMTVKSFAGHGINFITNNDTSKMTIDTAGRVTMPYQPAFKVAYGNRSATGTDRVISTDAGDSFLTGRDIYDTGNNFNEATGRFTAPVAGTYLFVSQLMRFGTSGTILENRITKNGSSIWARAYADGYTASYQSSTLVTTTKMNTGDYVENFLQGTSSIYNDDSFFTGYLIG
jgi:hypothetical protein